MDFRGSVSEVARSVRRVLVVGLALGMAVVSPIVWWLTRPAENQPVRNQPFVWLPPRFEVDRDRPPEERVRLREREALVMILSIPDPFASEPYNVVAYRRGTDVAQWRLDGLVPTELAELSFIVPNDWLAPGDFILDLHGDGIGDAVIASYSVKLERR